jgi:DNA-binding CsgD family transcriptional regulator
MQPTVLLLTDADGLVERSNPAAEDLLGGGTGATCAAHIRAETLQGGAVCEARCVPGFAEGEQRDSGIVRVRGQSCRLVCSEVGGARVVGILPIRASGTVSDLTDREREVLVLIARGYTSGRIARRLEVATSTIRTHVEHIRAKLGVRTRSQAVARALAIGEIE